MKAIHQNGEEPLPKRAAILPIILFFPLLAQIVCGHDQFFNRNHHIRITLFPENKICGIFPTADDDTLHTIFSSFCFSILHPYNPHISIQVFSA